MNSQQNSKVKPDVEANLESLSDEKLNKMVTKLPTIFPYAMIPTRLPELYYNMKNKLYPEYLYYVLSIHLCMNQPYVILARMSVRISKIYQIDLSKIAKLKYSEEELEFRRRIFWSFYGADRGEMSFNGSLPTVQDRDIVVNLPTNDFWWRYGGECKAKHPEILLWNIIANNKHSEQFSKDNTKNYVKTQTLSGKINEFARRRWLKKVYNPDDDNNQLMLLIEKLNKFEETIVKNSPIDFDLIKEAYSKYKDTIRFVVDMEHIIYKNVFTQYYFFMKNNLYQTELVRVEGIHIHPERIISAKNILVDTANKQIDLIYELSKILSLEYWKSTTVITGLISAIICLNFMSIYLKDKNKDMKIKIEHLKEVYHKMSNYTEIPVILL
ncbi:hypothetical protein BB558_006286, partial [Smittium angustum]